KQVNRPDGKADELASAAIGPVEPKLVHVGNDRPGRQNGLVAEEAATRCAQVIQALVDGGSIVALSLLRSVERTPYVFEFTQDLRSKIFRRAGEIAQGRICYALIPACATAGNRKLRIHRKSV